DALTKFSRQINKEMGSAVPAALNTAAAASTNLQNQIEKLQENLGKGLQPATTASAKFLAQTLAEVQNSTAFDALNTEATKFADFLKENPQYAKLLGSALNELLTTGMQALVAEAERLLKYLEQNPDAIKQAIAQIADFGKLVADVIRFCGEVARTLKSWDDWLGKSNERFNGGTDNLITGVNKFLDYSKSVLTTWQGIVQTMANATGMTSDLKQTGSERPDSKAAALRDAIMGQESSGDHRAVNRHSGALGLYQIMPDNLPSWSKAAVGREVGRDEFLNDPKLQTKIANHQMATMFRTAMNSSGGNEDIAVRKVASEWYSGQQGLYDDPTPQYYGGGTYPSIREYTQSILSRYKPLAAKLGNLSQSGNAPQSGGAMSDNSSASGGINTSSRSTSTGTSKGVSGVDFNAAPPQQQQEKVYPVIGSFPITSGYGNRQHPTRGGIRFHDGIDLGTPTGTPVVSPMDGKVIRSGGTQGKDGEFGGYGKLVEVAFKDGTTAFFAHLSQNLVKVGEQVKAGQILAKTGSSGDGTGPHLHLGASKNGQSIDPSFLLGYKRINSPTQGTATGSDAISDLQAEQDAAREARELLAKRRAKEKEATDRARLERDRDLALRHQREDAESESAIAKTRNPELKAQLQNQSQITQKNRAAEDQVRKAKDDLQDLISARTAKIQDGDEGGIDYSKAIENQKKYIASLENLKTSLSEAPKAEWANKVTESIENLTKATNEGGDAVFEMANQYENGDSPAIQHIKNLNSINAAYESQKQRIVETLKSAKELAAVAPSAELSAIIGRNEANLQRLDEGQKRAIERATALEEQAEKERQKQQRIDQISVSGERRNTLASGRLGLLQGQISFGNLIGGDTRELQREEASLKEALRFEDQIDGLKQLHEQGKISWLTLKDLTDQAEQLNAVNLASINQQFNETREIISDNVLPPFKNFVTEMWQGTKSIGDAFKNMISGLLQNLTQLAVNKLFTGLFGKLFGGIGGEFSGIPDIASPILNFASGGDVPAIGGNSFRSGYGEISAALRREGPNSVLAALTPKEKVLNVDEAMAYRKLFPNGIGSVANFSVGGDVGKIMPVASIPLTGGNSGGGQNLSFHTSVQVSSDSGIDPRRVQEHFQKTVQDEMLRQTRPGGLLYRG
ncbi:MULTISPECIES: peptidoglycan DD-metalloendopeptidase family protein, partial [Leptolyngbya]